MFASTFREANEELEKISREIQTKTGELELARETFLLKKAEHENKVASVQLEVKLRNPDATQTDIKAKSTTESYSQHLEMIKAKCTYSKLNNELRALRDRLKAYQDMSYNLRKEASL